ncbi:MAG: 30S ribosomal protein S13 [Candidatus Burarchaeum sp.]|nr:30S ribosomal protein S13 [Candidatus Burarchaeum sp.]
MKNEESKTHGKEQHKEHGKEQPKPAEGGSQQAKSSQKHEGKKPDQRPTAPAKPMKDYGQDFRGVVRLAGKDLKGEVPVRRALSRVKGIGDRLGPVLSEIATQQMKIANDTVIGLLTEEQMKQLEDILSHPEKYGVPNYLLNRQKDPETGVDRHIISTDVNFLMRQDIELDKTLNTWRGYRHLYGQKVRGQHSRTSGRTGMTVGVQRKTLMAAKEAAVAAEAKPKGGKIAGAEEKAAASPAEAGKPGAKTDAKPAAAKKEEKK